VHPSPQAGMRVTKAPLNTSDPACITTLSGVKRKALAKSEQYIPRTKWVCTMPLGWPVVPLL